MVLRAEPGKQRPRSCRAQELARSSAQENERQKKVDGPISVMKVGDGREHCKVKSVWARIGTGHFSRAAWGGKLETAKRDCVNRMEDSVQGRQRPRKVVA